MNDAILTALLERYFKVITKERIGSTPALTKEADDLEAAIRCRKVVLKTCPTSVIPSPA